MRPKGAQYDVYSDFTMYYLVGDKTISAAHKVMNDNGDNNEGNDNNEEPAPAPDNKLTADKSYQ